MDAKHIRNVAIIAHVDHGKTTLVDAMLRQTSAVHERGVKVERLMDTNDLEREKGITIFSKNASVIWDGFTINIVDTPGHADFGGEVERVLTMVDGALLLVDAAEGPMPQTKFVLRKALELGHKIIVVINKVDRKESRTDWVLNKTFDLFLDLGATDRQADFPVVYAAATQGKAGLTDELDIMSSIEPLLETVIENIPHPKADLDAPFQMLVVSVQDDEYKGKLSIGKILKGAVQRGQPITHINREGEQARAKVSEVLKYVGMERVSADEAHAGDIVAIAGISAARIGDTLACSDRPIALPPLHIDLPTVEMTFGVNTSPFSGREGTFVTSRKIRERLFKELETDVALRVTETDSADTYLVAGRGELHLAILVEKMRREGFEFQVGKPQVIFREVEGHREEPMEHVHVEVPEAYAGSVIEQLGARHGEMKDMRVEDGNAFMEFLVPTRGFLGYRTEFLTDTRGTGILNTLHGGYAPYVGEIPSHEKGFLIAYEDGVTSGYGLEAAEGRGLLFLGPQIPVYAGMIVGQNQRPGDLEVNVVKQKHKTNIRSSNSDIAVRLTPPRIMSLENAIEMLGDDDVLEVTPESFRLRKIELDHVKRRRSRNTAA
ncbi:MAG TPA: translational GTPase TypA [Armatimonadota bacterium]|jgi:GTP-binding protein